MHHYDGPDALVLAAAPACRLIATPLEPGDNLVVERSRRTLREKPRRRGLERNAWKRRQLEASVEEVTRRIEVAESRLGEIDAMFARASTYEGTGRADVVALEAERRELVAEIEQTGFG